MIKFKHVAAAVCAFSVVALSACKSTPEPEAPAIEEIVEEVQEVVEEAEEVVEEIQEAVDYTEANADLLAKAEEARNAAIASGADKFNAKAWTLAEAEYESVKALAATGADCSVALKDLQKRYEALAAFARAQSKKERIDSLEYASYNQGAYDNGVEILESVNALENIFSLGDSLNKKAQDCEDSFNAVLDSAFRTLAKEQRTLAFTAKKSADEVKASVSRKAEYDKGVEAFKAGDSAYVTKNPEGALNSYTQSKEIFTKLAEEISAARAKAQAAVEAAKKRVAQSESVAATADVEKPLGDEPVEGIEAEDAQLLEADDFTQAESSSVELDAELPEDLSEAK